MANERRTTIGPFFRGWVWATFLGWILGFFGGFVAAHVAEIFLGRETQFALGVGLGLAVAYFQGRLLAKRVPSAKAWAWAWAGLMGMGVAFIAGDIADAVGVGAPIQKHWIQILGGLLTGFLQWRLLRPHSRHAGWWVLACVAGWELAFLTPDLPYFLGSGESALFTVAAMLFGGVTLGVVTGGVLVWLLERSPASGQSETAKPA